MPLNVVKKAPKAPSPPPAAPAKQVKSATATVNKSMPDGSESSTTEDLGHALIEGPSATIEILVGLTRNLGNYESIRFQVGITMPVKVDEAEIEEAYTEAKEWVDTKINEINGEVDALIGGKE